MLWSLSTGADGPMHYLMGTMHVGSRGAYRYASLAKAKIAECHAYYGEIDLSAVDQQELGRAYLLPGDTTLADLVGQKKYRKWLHICRKAFRMDLESMSTMRPMLTLSTLSAGLLSDSSLLPLDRYLWNFAQGNDLRMGGVESFEFQRDLLLRLPLEPQLLAMKRSFANVGQFAKKARHQAEVYEEGDYQRLYKITAAGLQGFRGPMLYDRNQAMTVRIEEVCQERVPSFFAVGAAHIGGQYGIRAHLLRAGYRVRRVDL